MKALTITQPWAQLVADGRKRWETRSWSTAPTGEVIAIHAAKGWRADDREFARELGYDPATLPLGAVVATARISRVMPTDRAERTIRAEMEASDAYAELVAGDYSPGRFAWHLTDIRKLPEPIPCRGALGLWVLPEIAVGADSP